MFCGAFAGLRHTFHDQLAEGDNVASRVSFHGTHHDEVQDVPATGSEVAFDRILIDRTAPRKEQAMTTVSESSTTTIAAPPEEGGERAGSFDRGPPPPGPPPARTGVNGWT